MFASVSLCCYSTNRRERCCRSLAPFGTAHSRCKRVLENVESKQLGSREFWKIYNQVLKRGTATVSIISGFELISSSLTKAKLFATIVVSSFPLDENGRLLRDFPRLTEHNIFVTDLEVSRLSKSADTKMATGPDKISVVVLTSSYSRTY